MIARRLLAALTLVVALVSLSCGNQVTKESCLQEFPNDLCECPEPDGAPLPGPIVDLIEKPNNSAVFAWRLNAGEVAEEILEANEPSVFDNGCLVRKDLVGKKTMDFEFFDKDGNAIEYPGVLKLERTDGSITISISYLGAKKGLNWMIVKHTSPKKSCILEPGPITAGLPVEFDDLDITKLQELHSGEQEGSNIALQVNF